MLFGFALHRADDPVRHHDARKAEFAAQDPLDQIPLLRSVHPVYEVIGGHQRKGLALPHADPETPQIQLPQSAFADLAVGVVAVILLVVGRKVLDRHPAARVLLHAPGQRSGHLAGDQRILGKILKVPAAADVPVQIQRRSQPHMHAKAHHLVAHNVAAGLTQLLVPALRQRSADGDRGGILAVLFSLRRLAAQLAHEPGQRGGQQLSHALRQGLPNGVDAFFVHRVELTEAQARRAVRHYQGGDPLLPQGTGGLPRRAGDGFARVADHALDPAALKGADAHQAQLLVGELLHQRVDLLLPLIAHFLTLDLLGAEAQAVQRAFFFLLLLRRAPVAEIRLAAAGSALERHRILVQAKNADLLCLRAAGSQTQHIAASLQRPGALVLVVVGQIPQGEAQRDF